jgi:endoglucanase
MNEPHDMGDADWHRTSAAVVRALREAGDRNWIWVAGDGWSKAGEWTRHNPDRPWIDDPLERTAYEAHLYFDADASGRYAVSFADELAADPSAGARGHARLAPFLEWCEAGGVRGVIGEFGVPWYDPGWLPVLEDFLAEVRSAHVTAVAWAGGDWWGDYALSLQPRGGVAVAPLRAMLLRDERPTP